MKRIGTIFMFGLTSMAALAIQPSPAQSAGCYGGYGLTDYNRHWNEPGSPNFCSRGASDPRSMDACIRGFNEGLRMARNFGSSNGRILGLSMGYSYGMHEAFNVYQNDPGAFKAGQDSVQGSDYSRATSEGSSAAYDPARTTAESDAIDRFEAAVDSHSEPVSTVSVPDHRYAGIQNGWTRMGFPYKSEEDFVDQAIAKLRYSTPSFHGINDGGFDDVRGWGYRDLWRGRDLQGTYGRYNWKDSDVAWNISMRGPAAREYNNLQPLTETYVEKVEKPVLDKEGRQRVDEHGKPMTTWENVTKTRVLKEAEYFRGLWKTSFAQTYSYYVEYFFSGAYGPSVQEGCASGREIGQEMGQEFSYQQGQVTQYNYLYTIASQNGYDSGYTNTYKQTFKNVFGDYLSNPKIKVTDLQFVGKVNDNINQPGEQISARFALTNLGGVGKTIAASIEGDGVQASTASASFNVNRLSKDSFATDYIGTIRSDLTPGQVAMVQLDVDGKKAFDRASLAIHQLVEVQSIGFQYVEATHGRGQLKIVLTNPTNHESPLGVKATVNINGLNPMNVAFDAIPGNNGVKELTAPFEGLDPLRLIVDETVTGVISLDYNGVTLHNVKTQARINKQVELAHYFQELVNKQATIGTAADNETRLDQVKRAIYDEVSKEVNNRDGDTWRKDPNSTVVGQLVNQFRSVAQSPEAQAQYQALGTSIWPLRMKVDLGLNSQRTAFMDLVKVFAPKQEGGKKK